MRLHRFFSSASLEAASDQSMHIVKERALTHQLKNVLRAKVGDPIELFDAQGTVIRGAIHAIERDSISIKIESREAKPAPAGQITLYLAMLKRENFELAVQKATEVGATAIVPIITERTIKTGFNKERIAKIIIEAVEQSGRTFIPTLSDPMRFEDAAKKAHAKKCFLDFGGTPIQAALAGGQDDIALFVGPEGGWTDHEREIAEGSGLLNVSIGDATLRAETAAIVAVYAAALGK